ncbi:MAG TPA: tetratricopeptide repeat protein [Candidatus Saccharimonadales bacterium]
MDDNTVNFGSDDKMTAFWRWFARRVVIVPLLAVAITVVGVWVFMNMNKATDKKQSALQSAIAAAESATTNTGDYSQAYNTLKSVSGQATTTAEKVQLYDQLAAAAANDGKLPEAIDYLNKKHALDSSTVGADAYTMGDYYSRLGDNANALKQYRLALSYAKSQPNNERSQADIQGLEQLIQNFGGS